MKETNFIKCPNCKAEYHPAEIFIGKYLLGNPKGIIRDENNKIVYFGGTDMNPYETYNCDYCHKDFSIEATIKFTSAVLTENEDYVTKIDRKNLFLEEN